MVKNKLVMLVGPPGSGKGAQALLLKEKKKMTHLEVSKLLEKKFLNAPEEEVLKIGQKEYSLKEQKRRWKEGLLCEDEFVAHVIKETIEELKGKSEIVLIDGYPRTVDQAKIAFPALSSFYETDSIVTLFLEVNEEESIKRNTQRRVCSLMRHSILDNSETKNLTICPLDGSTLEKRVMDDPETIKVRLKEFEEKTAPVLDYLSSEGIRVSRVDGTGTVSEVFEKIEKELEDFGI